MNITIRKAAISDAAIIGCIGVKSWQSAYRGIVSDHFLDNMSVEMRTERVLNSIRSGNIFAVAEKDDITIGMICFFPSDSVKRIWEIGAIYVLPEYWHYGAGSSLINYAFDKMTVEKVKSCFVWVFDDNNLGRGFYKKMKFNPTGDEKMLELEGIKYKAIKYNIQF